MKAIYKCLLDKAIGAAVAAIEVYNKPHFKYRDESFVILLVNAWELLLKAKIVKDAKNKLSALYVHQGHRLKRNRAGNPLTIEFFGCIQKVGLHQTVADNLASLVEIRDAAIHFYNDDRVKYLVFTLGVAALKNFQHLVKDWFGKSLAEYHFYILPLGFSFNFQTIRLIELEKTPTAVANLIRSATEAQQRVKGGDEFAFACEIATEMKSAKKFADSADLTVKVDPTAKDAAVVIMQVKRKLDQYPLSFSELVQKVKAKHPTAKSQAIFDIMKRFNIKKNETYAAYSFRTKAHEDQYAKTGKLPSGTTSIYNEEAVRFIAEKLEEMNAAKAGGT